MTQGVRKQLGTTRVPGRIIPLCDVVASTGIVTTAIPGGILATAPTSPGSVNLFFRIQSPGITGTFSERSVISSSDVMAPSGAVDTGTSTNFVFNSSRRVPT